VVRKQLAGLVPTQRAERPEVLYQPAAKDRVYRALLERASDVVASGRLVVLDATFSKRAHRAEARAWASRAGVPLRVVEARASEAETRDRLARRRAQGSDASDAGPELLAQSRREFEPLADDFVASTSAVWTDRADWEQVVDALARELRVPTGA
jgi:hypothetical protein